jgi:hypothetical protein
MRWKFQSGHEQEIMRKKAVILNDTRGDAHFGCERVMCMIENLLTDRGIDVIATSIIRNDWENDRCFLDRMEKSDLILVNGEGTLHHGTKYGERLLRVAIHPSREGKKLALVNALYEENPAFWGEYLSRFDVLAARDAESQQEIERACLKSALFCPDLSLSSGFISPSAPSTVRSLLTIGDSVRKETTSALKSLANVVPEARYLSILSQLKNPRSHASFPHRAIRGVYSGVYNRMARLDKRLIMPKTQDDFITWLYRSSLHVTGRFHGICLCLATETPFLAVKSNSRKIESLLDFFGLGRDRLVDVETAKSMLRNGHVLEFSGHEKRMIRKGLKTAMLDAEYLFDAVANYIV